MTNKEKVSFQNVQVVVTPSRDAAGAVSYSYTTEPTKLVITQRDTIINFQLVLPTPPDVVFTGMTLSPSSRQFSTPTISTDGKNVTISDVNTAVGDFTWNFAFNGVTATRASSSTMTLMATDPDIENRPGSPPPPPPPGP
ncbi:hypothetical protein [Massilia endophytica]|uniref:hypothetical protein n=1 Tax=Massilia endophytica TaxID=2899220 RepID=UPI001E4708AA|nr:hypothetical protein [Massilia endophytica]UGQ48902.1 hypothetical protein LSQ66_10690 [Massilia endophytica]